MSDRETELGALLLEATETFAKCERGEFGKPWPSSNRLTWQLLSEAYGTIAKLKEKAKKCPNCA